MWTPFANQWRIRHIDTCSKAMSNIIEIAAGVYIAAIITFVILYSRIKAWLHGVPRLSKEQLDRHAMWRLRQIGEGRMDARAACMVIPSEADLLASEAAWRREVEQARREIAAKKEEASLTPPEITPHEHTPTEAHPRIVIELVADPKFKVSPGLFRMHFARSLPIIARSCANSPVTADSAK